MRDKYTGWLQILCLVAAVVFLVCFCVIGCACTTEQKSGVVSVEVNKNEPTDRFETIEEWTEKPSSFTTVKHAIVKDTSTNMLYYACYLANSYYSLTPYYASDGSVMDYDRYIKWYKDK